MSNTIRDVVRSLMFNKRGKVFNLYLQNNPDGRLEEETPMLVADLLHYEVELVGTDLGGVTVKVVGKTTQHYVEYLDIAAVSRAGDTSLVTFEWVPPEPQPTTIPKLH